MEFFKDFSRFSRGFDHCITTIDSHTEGEATRLLVHGIGPVPGRTMTDKLEWFKTNHDGIRRVLTREPRGSKEILAALVTEGVTPGAGFGLIYMDARRYPYLCGHATIGAVVTLAETGFLSLQPGPNTVIVDTPSGPMTAGVFFEAGRVADVTLEMVPSFVYALDQAVEIEGFGTVPLDLVCTGGFFAMVDARRIGMDPVLENKAFLTDLGMKIIDAANEQLSVVHPLRPDVRTVDVTEFYDTGTQGNRLSGRGMVIYGESHADRSPCGTGTAAKLTLLHHYGKIRENEPYVNYSPLGTSFEAMLVREQPIGSLTARVVQIKGRAYLTGIHHFIVEDRDPFPQGYLM